MSESGLSLGYSDIAALVARTALQAPISSDRWSEQNQNDIYAALDKGYRDFLMYPAQQGMEWSFLSKNTTLTTSTPYSTGTISIDEDGTTVTLADGTWPSWAAQGVLYYDSVEYEIDTRTDGSEVELAAAWPEDAVSGGSYELRRVAYTLADDFNNMKGWLKYSSEHSRKRIARVGEEKLLADRSGKTGTGYPQEAALRPQTGAFDGTAGQRWELLLFPLADAEYIFYYSYEILVDTQLRTDTPYPVGGMSASEAIQDCCIAAARYLFRDMPLAEYKAAVHAACEPLLRSDARRDPTTLGYNRDGSDDSAGSYMYDTDRVVTLNGVTPD